VHYLWDRQSGLPLLVDDGVHGYVHADGVQEQIAGMTARTLLPDGLGSVRGSADGTGTLSGSADYEVFGTARGANSTGSVFGFTGEQTDAETGLLYLRAREYDPASGTFLSADSVQPNAAGTQGYNLYSYATNNPTTWVDPSGHSHSSVEKLRLPGVIYACLHTVWCERLLIDGITRAGIGYGALLAGLLVGAPAISPVSALMILGGKLEIIFALVACMLDIRQVHGQGPAGIQFGEGLSCYVMYDQHTGWDCVLLPAEFCRRGGAGGDPSPCVPASGRAFRSDSDPCDPWKDDKATRCKDPTWQPGPYKDLPDIRGPNDPGYEFKDEKVREQIFEANWIRNGSRTTPEGYWILRSDGDGRDMVWDPKTGRGVSTGDDQPQIDHICPKGYPWGGRNDNANACVLSREENGRKRDNPPFVCGR
jgi:RHS repeat-associated protein